MHKSAVLLFLLMGLLSTGCSHQLEITNLDDYYAPPAPPYGQRTTIGITSANTGDPENGLYIAAIVDALQRSGSFDRVIYPYEATEHRDIVRSIVDVHVIPRYSGSRTNFLISFPGFLIFAPALWGYGYQADINTNIKIHHGDGGSIREFSVPTRYAFRQAEIDRTWTEVGWLEWGVIPFFGGIYCMDYDPDVTREFIAAVGPHYGPFIATRIVPQALEAPAGGQTTPGAGPPPAEPQPRQEDGPGPVN